MPSEHEHNFLETVKKLNQLYERHSGIACKLAVDTFQKDALWLEFNKHFNDVDLVRVLNYLRREIRARRRNEGCLRFTNLIGNLTNFEFENSLATAEVLRQRKPETPRQQVLKQTGRVEKQPDKVTTPKEVVEKLLQDFRNSVI